MNSKFFVFGLLIGGLALSGWFRSATQPNLQTEENGLRAFAADLLWVRAYAQWERHDVVATTQSLWQVVRFDPKPLHYWLNGARMMAYDMPVWRGSEDPAQRLSTRTRIVEEQVSSAINYLKKGREAHTRSSALWIEQGNIELNRLHDPAAAAESYRKAAELADAPYYAARIHAELLRRAGRSREAYLWLRKIYPALPRRNPEAAATLVLARMRELEAALALPAEQCYREGGL